MLYRHYITKLRNHNGRLAIATEYAGSFLMVGGNQSTSNKSACRWREHANSTEEEPGLWDLNSGPSCCEATVLTTALCKNISSNCY